MDELMIDDLWPRIRTTVERYQELYELSNVGAVLKQKPLREQLRYWLTLSELNELVDADVVDLARKERHGG